MPTQEGQTDKKPDSVPDVPVVPVVEPPGLPPLPESPSDADDSRSDYGRHRGSAAAVQPSKPAVATQDKTKQSKRRGASADPGRKGRSRSRSEDKKAESGASAARASFQSDQIQLMKAQIAGLGARVDQLETQQQDGHNAIASFADKLVEENRKLDQRLVEMQNASNTHLSTIEETFKRCDAVLEDLRLASQTANAAAAHALASSSGAASSSGPPTSVTRSRCKELWPSSRALS